jgi:hypothetical protein
VVQESIRRHRKMRDRYEGSDVRACKQKSVGTTIGDAFRECGMGTYSEYQLHYSADGGDITRAGGHCAPLNKSYIAIQVLNHSNYPNPV